MVAICVHRKMVAKNRKFMKFHIFLIISLFFLQTQIHAMVVWGKWEDEGTKIQYLTFFTVFFYFIRHSSLSFRLKNFCSLSYPYCSQIVVVRGSPSTKNEWKNREKSFKPYSTTSFTLTTTKLHPQSYARKFCALLGEDFLNQHS